MFVVYSFVVKKIEINEGKKTMDLFVNSWNFFFNSLIHDFYFSIH